jgi:FKBP-type peptidyl-prolyl cis-trans isomerase
MLMKGSSGRIFIPSKYAFGSQGTSLVPPNTSVIYKVSLDDVQRTTAQQAQFQADTSAIHNYIKANSVTIKNPILHSTGIWYTIDNLGAGVPPTIFDQVTVDLEGVIMANTKTFAKASMTQYNIYNLINGLRIGIPLMQKGNTATFYIPSGLAYGSRTDSVIPANSNLIFKITLTSIF